MPNCAGHAGRALTSLRGDDDDYGPQPVHLRANVVFWSTVTPDPSNFAVPSYCTCKQGTRFW